MVPPPGITGLLSALPSLQWKMICLLQTDGKAQVLCAMREQSAGWALEFEHSQDHKVFVCTKCNWWVKEVSWRIVCKVQTAAIHMTYMYVWHMYDILSTVLVTNTSYQAGHLTYCVKWHLWQHGEKCTSQMHSLLEKQANFCVDFHRTYVQTFQWNRVLSQKTKKLGRQPHVSLYFCP